MILSAAVSTDAKEDLADQILYSSEKRLARLLLKLSQYRQDPELARIVPKMSYDTLAKMVGTTRPRISQFMNKFRNLGLVKYDGDIEVNAPLLNFFVEKGFLDKAKSGSAPAGIVQPPKDAEQRKRTTE